MRKLMLPLLPFLVFGLTACGQAQPASLPDEPGLTQSAPDSSPDQGAIAPTQGSIAPVSNPADVNAVLQKYQHIDPNHLVNSTVLANALLAFDANKNSFSNQTYIVVVDFSLRSDQHRFFVVNLQTGAVAGYPVAHGRNSDGNPNGTSTGYAVRFSNAPGSNESSLGVYLTAETYSGKHGYSMRVRGLSSTNSNVYARAVVVHGANYVQDANVLQGRSDGCFALPMNERAGIIDQIKGGAMIYAGLEK